MFKKGGLFSENVQNIISMVNNGPGAGVKNPIELQNEKIKRLKIYETSENTLQSLENVLEDIEGLKVLKEAKDKLNSQELTNLESQKVRAIAEIKKLSEMLGKCNAKLNE